MLINKIVCVFHGGNDKEIGLPCLFVAVLWSWLDCSGYAKQLPSLSKYLLCHLDVRDTPPLSEERNAAATEEQTISLTAPHSVCENVFWYASALNPCQLECEPLTMTGFGD